MQDYIAMVIIWYATQLAADGNNGQLNQDIAASLSKLETLLDNSL